MAQEVEVTLIVKTEEAAEELRRFADELNTVKETAVTGGQDASRSWGKLGDLFSKVLPRDLQGTIRTMKMATRTVNQASKSIKWLGKAWAGVGIGALLIGLTALIENWESITDAINGTTAASRRLEEVNKGLIKQQEDFTRETQPYVDIVNDVTSSTELRSAATETLVKLMPELNGLDLTSAENQERLNIALIQNKALREQTYLLEQQELDYKAAKAKAETGELTTWQSIKASMYGRAAGAKALQMVSENMAEGQEELNVIEDKYSDILKDQLIAQDDVNEARKEAAKLAREKLAREKKAIQDGKDAENAAEAKAKFMLTTQQSIDRQMIQLQDTTERKKAEDLLEFDQAAAETQFHQREFEEEELAIFLLEQRTERLAFKVTWDEKEQAQDALANAALTKAQDEVSAEYAHNQLSEMDQELADLAVFWEKKLALFKEGSAMWVKLHKEFTDKAKAITDKYQKVETDSTQQAFDDRLAAAGKFTNQFASLMGLLSDAAEEGSAKQKRLAKTEIALNTAVAMANAIAGAAKAAKDKSVAAPFVFAGYIISMFATIANATKQMNAVMGDAGESITESQVPQPVVPQIGDDFMDNEFTGEGSRNFRAYVVTSDLEGAMTNGALLASRASL
tara:strand:+ start:534 stop:2414 length:1881 start_codon:yes stop_codon:yes gene_type:complete